MRKLGDQWTELVGDDTEHIRGAGEHLAKLDNFCRAQQLESRRLVDRTACAPCMVAECFSIASAFCFMDTLPSESVAIAALSITCVRVRISTHTSAGYAH